jgi:NAD-dependent DNA ligase
MMRAVTERGGNVHTRVTRSTDFLVVGHKGSKRWKYPLCGNKTAAALRLISAGGGIRIVGEEAFWAGMG